MRFFDCQQTYQFKKAFPQRQIIFKIYLERAYEHVEWNFVAYVLERFGFRDT